MPTTPNELTAGLEVHQQLSTKKLFCRCPSALRDDAPDFVIERRLRASAGESGTKDKAAEHEEHKEKKYLYQGYVDTTCLVEMDEEPVSGLNEEALTVAIQVARLLNMRIVDEIHVMRKTVVDGSNTSGFQRTALIALDGSMEIDGKAVRIEQLCLEEDSCKVVKRESDMDTYNLSRLGIPLIEITTAPDLTNADEVKKAAAHLGMILRSTEKVKRGLGTIRQDVNVSVPGGERVEIKGAQDLENLSLIVENEAARQRVLINLAQAVPKQDYSIIDVTNAFKETKAAFIKKTLGAGACALGIKLAGYNDALDAELSAGLRLGRELAAYAKSHGFGGLIHSSEDFSKYSFDKEPANVRKTLSCMEGDAWLVMVGEKNKLARFLEQVLVPRLEALSVGVPSEVRKAELDATTSYLRPMPGAARMYPETDVRPITPHAFDTPLPELITHKALRIAKQYSIAFELSEQICKEGLGSTLEKWINDYPKINPSTLASLLASKEREIKTRHNIEIDIVALAPEFLPALNAGEIALSSVEDILVALGKGEAINLALYRAVSDEEIGFVAQQLVNENPGARLGLLMGKVMRHFSNRADGKKVQEILRKAGVQN